MEAARKLFRLVWRTWISVRGQEYRFSKAHHSPTHRHHRKSAPFTSIRGAQSKWTTGSQSHKSTWKIYGEALSPTFPCCAIIVPLVEQENTLSKHCLLSQRQNFLPSTLILSKTEGDRVIFSRSVSQSCSVTPWTAPCTVTDTGVRAAPFTSTAGHSGAGQAEQHFTKSVIASIFAYTPPCLKTICRQRVSIIISQILGKAQILGSA